MTDRELMQQALETLGAIAVHGDVACVVAPEKEFWLQPIITALRERLAQPEQEPVAWEDVLGAIARGWTHDDNKHKTMDVQLAVAIAKEIQDMVAAPPQRREWQGLTEEEIRSLNNWWPSYDNRTALMVLIRDAEAKLKEKNA